MTNLNAIIKISDLCKQNNINMTIDGSGIILTAGSISKRYELDMLSKIVQDLPLEVIIDLFLEEMVLNFQKAAY